MNFDDFGWSVAQGSHDALPVLTRFRQFPASFPRADFPHRLNFFWSFVTPTDAGLPSPDDSQAASTFEDRLIDAVEPDSQAVLCAVLTGRGMREFVFQTTDPGDFLRRLTEMPQEEEPYPIQIQHEEDPTWDYFDRVTGATHP